MKNLIKKKIILIALSLFFFLVTGQSIHATSGACSSHLGVNCSSGIDIDGSVVCKDGTRESSVPYDFMIMCIDQKKIEINNYCIGLRSQFEYYVKVKDSYLKSINEMIDKTEGQLMSTDTGNPEVAERYDNYLNYLYALKERQNERYKTAVQNMIDSCKVDELNEWYSKIESAGIPTKTNDQICQDSYGLNSVWDGTKNNTGDLNCGCKNGYQWNKEVTSCIITPIVPIKTNEEKSTEIETKTESVEEETFIMDSENSFFGLYEGAGLVRDCPSFDCKIIKYGATCPLTEVLFKEDDWYKVKFIERGFYDEYSNNETCGGHGKLLSKSSWSTFEGWMPSQVIPPQIRQNISEKIPEDEIVSDKDKTENLASVGVVNISTSTEKTKSKSLWSKIKSWLIFWR